MAVWRECTTVDNEPPDHDADPCRTPPVGPQANLGAAADEKEIKEPAEDAVEESQEHDLASSRARSLARQPRIGLFAPHTASRCRSG